ncbi:MAG: hypothetical protein WA624_12820, partial [Methylocella sp.]
MGEASRPGVLVARGTSSVPLAPCAPLAPLVKAGRWLTLGVGHPNLFAETGNFDYRRFFLIAVVDWELPNK